MAYGKVSDDFKVLIEKRVMEIGAEVSLLADTISEKERIYKYNAEKEFEKIFDKMRGGMKWGNVAPLFVHLRYAGDLSYGDNIIFRHNLYNFRQEMENYIIVNLELTEQKDRLTKLETLLKEVEVKYSEKFDIDKITKEFQKSDLYNITRI